jgi:hypothetical protein
MCAAAGSVRRLSDRGRGARRGHCRLWSGAAAGVGDDGAAFGFDCDCANYQAAPRPTALRGFTRANGAIWIHALWGRT